MKEYLLKLLLYVVASNVFAGFITFAIKDYKKNEYFNVGLYIFGSIFISAMAIKLLLI